MKTGFLAATALGVALAAQPAAAQIFKQANVIKNDMTADEKALVETWNGYQNCVNRAQRDLQVQEKVLYDEVHHIYDRAQKNPQRNIKDDIDKSARLQGRSLIDYEALPVPLPPLGTKQGQNIAVKLFFNLTKNDISAWEKCGDQLGVSGGYNAQHTDRARLTKITLREIDLKDKICALQARGMVVSSICPRTGSKGP